MIFDENNPYFHQNNPDREENPTPAPITGKAKIKVIGVGGAGNNAINNMIDAGLGSADFIAVNTDAQILACNKAPLRIQIGAQKTKGLGAGSDPEIGKEAAEESKEELSQIIEGTDLLFIAAGMGGGTGTGAAPVIAKIAQDKRILTVAVVTKPFNFEGPRRMENAMRGIENLRRFVDTLIIIPNEKILEVVPPNTSVPDAFRVADEVLRQGIKGIVEVITTPSLINLDFADVRTVLKGSGLAHMGVGVARGENRIVNAVKLAVNSPLLDTTIEGATNVLLNVVGGTDLSIFEANAAAELIRGVVDYSVNLINGCCIDQNMQDEVQVIVIATGFPVKDEPPKYVEEPTYQPRNVYDRQGPAPAPVPEQAPLPRNPYDRAPQAPVPQAEAPVPPQPAPADDNDDDDNGDARLPLFARRMRFGKKK